MRVKVNGIELHAEVSGEGPPLLLLHGFTGSCRSWDRFIPAWSKFRRVIAVDLIGHGESDAPEDPGRYAMEHAVEDLAALLDALGADSAEVLGYSMGGRVALSMAVLRPDKVRALLLESSSPGLPTAAEREERVLRDERLAGRIEREGLEWFVPYWESLPLFEGVKRLPPEAQQRIRSQRMRNRPHGLACSLRGMGTGKQPSWWDRLHELPMPVILVAGEEDGKFHSIAERMRMCIRRCTFIPVPEAGHLVHVEQASTFDTIVRNYMIAKGEEQEHASRTMGKNERI